MELKWFVESRSSRQERCGASGRVFKHSSVCIAHYLYILCDVTNDLLRNPYPSISRHLLGLCSKCMGIELLWSNLGELLQEHIFNYFLRRASWSLAFAVVHDSYGFYWETHLTGLLFPFKCVVLNGFPYHSLALLYALSPSFPSQRLGS